MQAHFPDHQADVPGQQSIGMSGATQAGIVGPHDRRHLVGLWRPAIIDRIQAPSRPTR